MDDQLLVGGGEQGDLQLAVFEIPPADCGAVYKDGGANDPGAGEDIPHRFPGEEQAFRFLIAQHELVKAGEEQAGGHLGGGQSIVNAEIGLAIQSGFGDGELLQPGLDLGLGGAEEVGGILDGGGAKWVKYRRASSIRAGASAIGSKAGQSR